MGRVVARTDLSDREQYRAKLRRCLEALRRMVGEDRFAVDELRTGVELELALVDQDMEPAMLNHAVLDRSASDLLTTELGRWNLEINLPPRTLPGTAACQLEADVVASIEGARRSAAVVGATPVTIGILPTLGAEHLDSDQLTDDPRYDLLNRQMVDARGEPFRLDIAAPRSDDPGSRDEHLVLDVDSIAPEAACTSLQLHLQLTPETFPAHWNAAQAIAGVQVALAANSPFLLGHRLWAETRVPLFEQAVDVRTVELRNQGVRPRVWFGDRWAASVTDLFEENVRYFPALLPMVDDEDPLAALDAGQAPGLHELRLHSGTVWRWNRPVYDVADGVAHLRLENRVLPAGPSAVDAVANALFFYGLVRALVASEHPPWRSMTFEAAHDNFVAGAQHGLDAELYWPGAGTVGVDRLVLDRLLPLAREGLRAWDVEPFVADRYLSVIEARCRSGCTGASWQTQMVAALEKNGCPRPVAMRRMLERYVAHMSANLPVHTWPVMEEPIT
jgi:hypothetical protein